MNITELDSFAFGRFELGLTRSSFHETGILQQDRKYNEQDYAREASARYKDSLEK